LITREIIKTYATKYQTIELNVAREYCQHLLLSYFYHQKESERILFKGGTALKIIYGSPRFSEDLDFSGYNVNLSYVEKLVEDSLIEIKREGLNVEMTESKETTGGYLSIIFFKFYDYKLRVQLEISLREERNIESQAKLITSNLLPAYTILQLPEELLVIEKFEALFRREKPRDFFDIYFILRNRLVVQRDYIEKHMVREKILEILKNRPIDFKGELKLFLPINQHALLKDFDKILANEIEKYL
jgi:predicted nucleotidyltransferase component of viral defense system